MKSVLKIFGYTIFLTSGIYALFLSEITPLFSKFREGLFAYIHPDLKPFLIMIIAAICFMGVKMFIPD